MGAVTLPAYSLAVLMGSDVKAHMLPKRFAKKLLAVAAAAKTRVREEKAQQARLHRTSGPIPAALARVSASMLARVSATRASATQPAKEAQQEAAPADVSAVNADPSEEATASGGEEEEMKRETAVAAPIPVAERATKATKGGLRRLGSMLAHHMVGHSADHYRRTTE